MDEHFGKTLPFRGISGGNLAEKRAGRHNKDGPLVSPRIGRENGEWGRADWGGRTVRSAGVEREPERLECGTGSLLVGPGGDLVSPDVVDHDADRACLVEHRGKERGGRELLGQGKGKPLFFSPSFRRTVVMKRWARKT